MKTFEVTRPISYNGAPKTPGEFIVGDPANPTIKSFLHFHSIKEASAADVQALGLAKEEPPAPPTAEHKALIAEHDELKADHARLVGAYERLAKQHQEATQPKTQSVPVEAPATAPAPAAAPVVEKAGEHKPANYDKPAPGKQASK